MSTRAEAGGGPAGRTQLRVRYPEIDRMGIAYHAHYLVWFELGRTELMRELGCPYGELEEVEGLRFPVTAVGARYLAPARYDDVLTVLTRLARVDRVRVRFEYELAREAGEPRLLATGFSEHAALGRTGRPRRVPEALRRWMAR
ncbi:MAG TPA: thioesterase family protein [Candidatus Polarisedimenticolaceae bacterium]|nr:thioesterase family protein [Candidatus Polarisedimenticolaceae bacterium]